MDQRTDPGAVITGDRDSSGADFSRASPGDVRIPRGVFAALALFAAINIAIGCLYATTRTDRWSDVLSVYVWCSAWLRNGAKLFTDPAWLPDYPPNAIVTFAPVAWLPRAAVIPIWTVVSLALLPVLPYVLARATAVPRRAIALLVVCFLGWGSARVLLQFSLLSLTLAFVAVWIANRRPMASGLCLGLALAKPHVAGPVALWALLERRWRVATIAAATVAVEVLVFCARARVSPAATVAGFWNILLDTYGGPEGSTGLTSVRAWTSALPLSLPAADAAWVSAAALLLLVPCGIALMAGATRRDADRLAILALGGLWSLLAVYHNGHNLILLLPAFVYVLMAPDGATDRERLVAAVLLQAAMMADAPVRLALAVNIDRPVVALAFGYVALRWWRRRRVEYGR